MANWEYAAIVTDSGSWFLTQPGKTHVFKYTDSRSRTGTLVGWRSPLTVGKIAESIDMYNAEIRAKNPQVKGHKIGKYSKKGVPSIIYESEDILTLVNMAGADGWEITGGLGLSEDHGRESRWRMMRREL